MHTQKKTEHNTQSLAYTHTFANVKLFGQGKENEYDDDITVVRGPPGPPGIDGNLLNANTHTHYVWFFSLTLAHSFHLCKIFSSRSLSPAQLHM